MHTSAIPEYVVGYFKQIRCNVVRAHCYLFSSIVMNLPTLCTAVGGMQKPLVF